VKKTAMWSKKCRCADLGAQSDGPVAQSPAMDYLLDLWSRQLVRDVAIAVGFIVGAYLAEVVVYRSLAFMARKTKGDLDDRIVQSIRRPIFLAVVFVGLGWAARRVGMSPGPLWVTDAMLKSITVAIWTVALLQIMSAVLRTLSLHKGDTGIVQSRTLPLFEIMSKIGVIGGAVYFGLLAWNIDVTAWLASAGIVGIAVGFAAKDTLANLFSGIFILVDAPYKVGDFVVLDGDLRGEVIMIGMRSTRILTRDDIEITVPNAVIGGSKIVNEAGGPHPKSRVGVTVEAAYGSDIDKVRQVLLQCPKGIPYVCENPGPVVRFRSFGASGLVFEILVWIEEPVRRGEVLDTLHVKVYKNFDEAGIEIPFSKHDVYIKQMPAS